MNNKLKSCRLCHGVGIEHEALGTICPECFPSCEVLNLWLDVKRPAPKGWTPCISVETILTFLSQHSFHRTDPKVAIGAISLDNDLGIGMTEGYKVLDWLDEKTALNKDFVPPVIYIHTENPSALARMTSARTQIQLRLDHRNIGKNIIGEYKE